MKNERYMDERDREELSEALYHLKRGQVMRRKVMSRIATRAWRDNSSHAR